MTAATATSRLRRGRSAEWLVERSTLHRALDDCRYRAVEYQIRLGGDPNVRNRRGLTPLMRCARLRPAAAGMRLVRVLLTSGADPDRTDSEGNNLLQLAVKEDNPHLMRLLLMENNVNFHHRDKDGQTVLHLLAHKPPEVATMLLTAAARFHIDCDVEDAEGLTPLMAACRAGNLPVVRIFANLGVGSFTRRDSGPWHRNAREWLDETLPTAFDDVEEDYVVRREMSGVRRRAPEADEDPYEKVRHARRVETLVRVLRSREQPQDEAIDPDADGTDAPAAPSDEPPEDRPATAKTDSAEDNASVASSQLLRATLRRSRTTFDEDCGCRLIRGLYGMYEAQMSASFRPPAVFKPLPSSAEEDSGRPVSRTSSGRSQQRSPGNMARRMTDFVGANVRLKRVKSGLRLASDAGVTETAAMAAQNFLSAAFDGPGRRSSTKN